MASDYTGVDNFSAVLSLLTSGDQPRAITFRVPLEALLDNTVHLKAIADADRARRLLKMHLVDSSTTSEDSLAAISRAREDGVILLKSSSNNAKRHHDAGKAVAGTVASITSLVSGAARITTTIMCVGTGGNRAAHSTNNGASWTASGNVGYVPGSIVGDGLSGRFLVNNPAGSAVSWNADLATWNSVATTLDTVTGGLAIGGNAAGTIIACGLDDGDGNNPDFSISVNGGTSWSAATGTVADAASYVDAGSVAGSGGSLVGGTFVWHVGRIGQSLRVSRTATGSAWTTMANIAAPSGLEFAGTPKIMHDGGVLVIAAPFTALEGGMVLFASFDGGTTWSEPLLGLSDLTSAYSFAGGRLFATFGAEVYASTGGS